MILYHGTSDIRAKSILSSGILKANNLELAHGKNIFCPTESGFLYLTNMIYQAIYYGKIHPDNLKENIGSERVIYIFKVNIDYDRLPPDTQDIQIQSGLSIITREFTAQESLDICCSVRTRDDLTLGKEVSGYTNIVYSPFSERENLKLIRTATKRAVKSSQPQQDFAESTFEWITL